MSEIALKREEDQSFSTEDREQPIPPENVVAYNELRSCADLNRMFVSGKLEIQPDFQREVVWKLPERTRFIDSLVKQLPIPSMCFSLDVKTQKWKVIDGLQRMDTITSFLGTGEMKLADVEDVHPALRGKKNTGLRLGSELEKRLYSSVEDISIPITVIRCDYEIESHMGYLFTIFNRLNSGGVRLNNQEIRNCIYSGTFNDLLKEFDAHDGQWRRVKARIWGHVNRFRSIEVLLRGLAFAAHLHQYDGNLARFLNNYMHANRRPNAECLQQLRENLQFAANSTAVVLGEMASGKKSLVVVEGVLVGILANITALRGLGENLDGFLRERARAFMQLQEFSSGARYALSSPQTVNERLTAARHVFAT
jgi:hypothetical protein